MISVIRDTVEIYGVYNTLYKKGFLRKKPSFVAVWKCVKKLKEKE